MATLLVLVLPRPKRVFTVAGVITARRGTTLKGPVGAAVTGATVGTVGTVARRDGVAAVVAATAGFLITASCGWWCWH